MAILLLATCGVAALLFISAMVSPHWVRAGWRDDSGGSNISAPLAWSPFSYCRGSYCTNLPSSDAGILANALNCTAPEAPSSRSTMEAQIRASQALSVLAFILMSCATAVILRFLTLLLSTQSVLRGIDASVASIKQDRYVGRYRHQEPLGGAPHAALTSASADSDPNRGLTPASRRRWGLDDNRATAEGERRQHEPHHTPQPQEDWEVVHATTSPAHTLPLHVVATMLVGALCESTRRDLQDAIDHLTVWHRPKGATSNASSGPTALPDSANAQQRIDSTLSALESLRDASASRPSRHLRHMPLLGLLLLVLLSLTTIFAAVAIGVFDHLQAKGLYCGADYCTVLEALAGTPCERGPAYRAFLAATIMSGMALLLSVILALHFRRPVQAAGQFSDRLFHELSLACSDAEETLWALYVALNAARLAGPRPTPMAAKPSANLGSVRRGGSSVYVPGGDSHSPLAAAGSGAIPASVYDRDTRLPSPSTRPPHDESHNAPSSPTAPQPPPRRATSSSSLEPGWVFSSEEQLYYHAGRKLYYDPDSQQYYDPKTEQWWDGTKWYRINA